MVEQKEASSEDMQYWFKAQDERSDRLNFMRAQRWQKSTSGGAFPKGVQFDVERTFWFTKVYKETEGEPWVLRRAKAVSEFLDNYPIFIRDRCQLVAYPCAKPNMVQMHCDGNTDNLWDFLWDRESYIPEEEQDWFEQCISYWDRVCMAGQLHRYMTTEEQMSYISFCQFAHTYLSSLSSAMIDYEFVFQNGLNGILEMIDKKLSEASDILHKGYSGPHQGGLFEKMDEWNAMKMTVEAVIRWAERYSRLATVIAENFETDTKRKAELVRMSEICAKVPANPPEHFHEALQAWEFINIAAKFIERQHTGHGFRADQVLFPYYKRDFLEDKSITRDELEDLFGEWELKVWEREHAMVKMERSLEGAGTVLPIMTLGGVLEDGSDACNELTEFILQVARKMRVNFPSWVFRYTPKGNQQAFKEAFECIRQGLGYPTIQNDTLLTETLVTHYGIPLKDARTWANVVCLSPAPTKGGKTQGVKYAGYLMPARCLEVALHNGVSPAIGAQVGPQTGDVTKMNSIEEVWEAYAKQMEYHTGMLCRIRNVAREGEARWLQQPFLSALCGQCIETGYDCVDYRNGIGSNPWHTITVGNEVGDCMYAIKKLVFDDKKYTMAQLMEALSADWENYEDMRLEFVNVPKWGNDIDEADYWTVKSHHLVADEFYKNRELAGMPWLTLPQNGGFYEMASSILGAMPNGRRMGDPVYDGGNSPGASFDKKGPTAVLRSCSKIDYRRQKSNLLNQRISPSQMSGEKGFQLFSNYVRTWYDLELPHIQFNCIDTNTLRSAQAEPEKYPELIVRVAGYSAHFVELCRAAQDSIVARTLQEM